jgi:hypothetical protein
MLARNPTHRPRRRVQEDQVVATLLEQLLARADVSLGLKLRKYRQAAAGDVKFFLRMERCPVRYPASLLSHLRHAERALCHRGSGVAQTRRLLSSDCVADHEYSDAKVANRDIRVWHGATDTGP